MTHILYLTVHCFLLLLSFIVIRGEMSRDRWVMVGGGALVCDSIGARIVLSTADSEAKTYCSPCTHIDSSRVSSMETDVYVRVGA